MTLDFSSARFLGLVGSSVLVVPPNPGKPAVLAEPPGADPLAASVADAQGAEQGLVARSTLHALCDVLAVAAPGAPVLVDEHCYPITRWAARATLKEGTMVSYHHQDARYVRCLLRQSRQPATVLVTCCVRGDHTERDLAAAAAALAAIARTAA